MHKTLQSRKYVWLKLLRFCIAFCLFNIFAVEGKKCFGSAEKLLRQYENKRQDCELWSLTRFIVMCLSSEEKLIHGDTYYLIVEFLGIKFLFHSEARLVGKNRRYFVSWTQKDLALIFWAKSYISDLNLKRR